MEGAAVLTGTIVSHLTWSVMNRGDHKQKDKGKNCIFQLEWENQ